MNALFTILRRPLLGLFLFSSLALLGACGGGGGGSSTGSPPAGTYTVGGSVSGLVGSGLRLQNNMGDDLDIAADGTFAFSTPVISGNGYSVSVAVQPNGPGQRCVVIDGIGTIASADVANVAVNCFNLQTVALRRRAGGTQNDLYLIREDGANLVTLADSTDEETFGGVASGGRAIFTRESGGVSDIYSIKLDGTGLITLANDASLGGNGGVGAGITPSGKVVFRRKQSIPNRFDLFVINSDGTNLVPLPSTTDNENYNGATTGGRVVFSRTLNAGTVNSHDDLFSVMEDGTGLATLANTTDFEEFQAITPGGRVIFARIIGSQRDLYSVNPDGTGLVALSTSPLSDEFFSVAANERVLFRREPTQGQSDLYSVKADGTGLVTLANSADPEHFAGTTPDGRVIFRRIVGGPQGDLYIINADGTGLLPLANSANDEFFAGVGPAHRIFFSRSDGSQYDLYAVDADGTREQRLTNTPEDEFTNCGTFGCLTEHGSITPSGRLIFLRQPVGGFQFNIHSINIDGTGEVLLAAAGNYLGTTASGRLIFSRSSGGGDIFSINDDGTDEQVLGDTADLEAVEGVF